MNSKIAEILKTLTEEIERLEAENMQLRAENEDTPQAKGRRFMKRVAQAAELKNHSTQV